MEKGLPMRIVQFVSGSGQMVDHGKMTLEVAANYIREMGTKFEKWDAAGRPGEVLALDVWEGCDFAAFDGDRLAYYFDDEWRPAEHDAEEFFSPKDEA